MRQRELGGTDLVVSLLGLGTMHLGDPAISEDHAGALLNAALDAGITLIDTARSYGLAEERIGRHLARRRQEFVLSTKVGYGISGLPDWRYETVLAGVDEALQRLRCDYVDIVHLHSCGLGTLEDGAVVEALQQAVSDGKVRVAAYSGENEALEFAIGCGGFGSIQTSVNLFDQRGIETQLPAAAVAGMGVIAKRPLGNAPWRFIERPVGQEADTYWQRWRTMGLEPDMPWEELALRFAAYTRNVASCIVGTTSIDHLLQNIALVEEGPLEDSLIAEIGDAFRGHDQGWDGAI